MIEVLRSGPLTTVQDSGRYGFGAFGVGTSGAADSRSASLANRLVGNPGHAACLEATFGGLALRFRHRAYVAVTGAPCPITCRGRGEGMNALFTMAPGEELQLGTPTTGMRTYIAVRGGIGVQPVLNSRATDVLSGLGPHPLAAGDLLPVGGARCEPLPPISVAPVSHPPSGELRVRVVIGPREDWFTPTSIEVLMNAQYVVTTQSDRVGIRLAGPPLVWACDHELLSEGMVFGAIQVPPSGLPVIFLSDHPVTGGYPVVAVVIAEDLPLIAQARPGQLISFRRGRQRVDSPHRT
ncbi:biotin-dependent carboxyltransferase family protein [Mycolicibacterium goodii]|uniref:5-oxoprolinase subunit C family protein n=1 Tax=Mycolicibacterium goodii TaxID=134601 RepID=UPI000C261862|nr:biotin-dependent carboxyltransferase family protein [Mycolicibacterium goodii]PJK20432.1 allophanate hydrolase [Mycolicibacterium goodii]